MRTIGYRFLLGCLLALCLAAPASAELRRGINITNWFRFPPSGDPAALRSYLDDTTMETLRQAGFDFVRLPIQPELLPASAAIADAVARLERHGLSVVAALAPASWHLEASAADRARLFAAWRSLSQLLQRFDPARTLPEVLNEPVFANDPGAWQALQHQVLAIIRATLPGNTIVLTGADWGSIAGLLAITPESDSNVIYSFHLYEPPELTALGAYRPGLDKAAMARLPFPVTDVSACTGIADSTADTATAGLMRFYCAQRWDAAKLGAHVAEAAAWAERHHARVIAGEFGASSQLNAPARSAWLSAVRKSCEQQALPWALWGYDDTMGFALHPPKPRGAPDPNVLRALGLTEQLHRIAQ